MRKEWLALSAAALVTGATALFFGAHLTPRPTGDGHIFRLASADPGLWTTSALVLFVGALGTLFGISCAVVLVQRRGFRTGVCAMALIAFASVVLAGFAMQLVLLRALSAAGVGADALAEAVGDPLQQGLLVGGFGSFYLGELLLAQALFRAGTTPKWVPLALVAHVLGVLVGVASGVDALGDASALLMVVGLAGVAVSANRPDVRLRAGAHT